MSRILTFHDMFVYKGGAERLTLLLAKSLDTDLASGFFDSVSFDPREEGFKGKLLTLTNPHGSSARRILRLKYHFLFKSRFVSEYDRIIFTGDCLSAIRFARRDARTLYYCNTPPRHLFDQKDAYLRKVSPWMRPAFLMLSSLFRRQYLSDLQRVDTIISNSRNIQRRVKQLTGHDSVVVHPPTDTRSFVPGEQQGDYYLSFSRLASLKRVDRIVEAFCRMPDKKLIFTYGSNHPEKDAILARAATAPNITAVLSPDDAQLRRLIQGAIATLYIPVDEDFGMIPVESMACGVPAIGVRDGGLQETIVHGETGTLIEPAAEIEDIIKSVREMPAERAWSMREACRLRSEDFSCDRFSQRMRELLDLSGANVVAEPPTAGTRQRHTNPLGRA